MKSKKAVSAASYPSRIFEDYQVLNDSDHLVVCPKLSINVAAGSKIKETTASLFFSRRQRSKVIFRVTQKSLRGFLSYFQKYLAPAGSPAPYSLLTMAACLMELWSKPALHLPLAACVMACPGAGMHPDFHNLKHNGYGK